MPLRFQNVCRHRQTNNTGRFTPPRTARVVSSPFLPRFFQTFPPFSKISCRPFHAAPHRTRCFLTFPAPLLSNFPAFPENLLPAVFRRSSHRTRCFLTFLPRFFQTFPPFSKISCRPFHAAPHRTRCFLAFLPRFSQVCLPFPKISCRPFHAAPHRTRCFLAFRSCSPLPCLTFSYHHFKSSPSPSPHNFFLNLSQHSK